METGPGCRNFIRQWVLVSVQTGTMAGNRNRIEGGFASLCPN